MGPSSYASFDETIVQRPEDGAVLLENPAAPPINGDTCTDRSSENVVPQGFPQIDICMYVSMLT